MDDVGPLRAVVRLAAEQEALVGVVQDEPGAVLARQLRQPFQLRSRQRDACMRTSATSEFSLCCVSRLLVKPSLAFTMHALLRSGQQERLWRCAQNLRGCWG